MKRFSMAENLPITDNSGKPDASLCAADRLSIKEITDFLKVFAKAELPEVEQFAAPAPLTCLRTRRDPP
ncbi:hypothetical protein [Alloyangia pacifica]|uniref:hypothetical protein n=1 Tax=Alloyangia pacifica TaxID=311180 RepID=UPI0015A411E2|nr:hypothetical protein [Alloyangia pacifica]